MANDKTDTWENGLLLLLFNNTTFAPVGSDGLRGSTTPGSLYMSLHVTDPGDAGNQTTGEVTYTPYVRKAIARSSAGFVVTANSVSPASDQDFDQCTASPGTTINYFGIGTAASGTGTLLYKSVAFSTPITMAVGVIPRIKAASTITED
jgi:hypothetical protein